MEVGSTVFGMPSSLRATPENGVSCNILPESWISSVSLELVFPTFGTVLIGEARRPIV